jgi:molecular chaperone HtpG
MPKEVDPTWDPLGGALPPEAEKYRRSREAENVLGSYFHATDLLAEALQNAADAIDQRAAIEDDEVPRVIEVVFDPDQRQFSVSDSGTGMSREALDIVFQPNITLKAGPLAKPAKGNWRGEKGVGLSFLLFSCDELKIRTCDGEHRFDAVIRGAASWAADPDASPDIEYELTVSDPDRHLASDRYTVVTLSEIDVDRFDVDLFGMCADQVEWILRTRTAVGNTAYLFEELEMSQPEEIVVWLRYESNAREDEEARRRIPYRYATPADLLVRAEELGVADEIPVYDYEDLIDLDVEDLRPRLKGAAVRYVAGYVTASGRDVAVYMFAMAGDLMRDLLSALDNHPEVEWVPGDWAGFWVATRGMPTGVPLTGGVLPTRGYEQRTFGLLQLDDLKLDVGRKSLHGRTTKMFKEIVRDLWNEDMRWIIERIPRSHQGKGAGALELERRMKRALRLPDLDAGIPFSKVPERRSDVAAVFHELIGSDRGILPQLHGLTTGLVTDSDLLARNGQPAPLHVIFGLDQLDVLKLFDAEQGAAETVDLAIIWEIVNSTPEATDTPPQLTVERIQGDDTYGATHWIRYRGLGGREEPLRALVITQALESQVAG